MTQTAADRFLEQLAEGLQSSLESSSSKTWEPLDHQRPPEDTDWDVWILLGGRGTGKTRGGVEYCMEHLREEGPRARVGVGAPTNQSAREVCAEGESGMMTLYGDEFVKYNRNTGEAWHEKGGYVKFQGTERPRMWNGPQWTLLWADELALWNTESWDQAQLGVRLGEWPRTVATTTPKNRKWVRDLAEEETTRVSHGTTFDNIHLPERRLRTFRRMYEGTRVGRQELYAQWLDDVEGALWTMDLIDRTRIMDHRLVPELVKVVVPVDPAASAHEKSDETGIGVVGIGWCDCKRLEEPELHGFVLDDVSGVYTPVQWGKRALKAYDEWQADRIVGERNNGGDLVERNLRAIRQEGWRFEGVWASRGKQRRAEPVLSLYEQGRVHHVGQFPELEEQMTTWVPDDESAPSPDRMDALVWGMTKLLVERMQMLGDVDDYLDYRPGGYAA